MNEKPLSSRQLEILNFIKAYLGKNGVPPSIREIAKGVGLASISTVHSHLTSLENKGYIRRDKAKPRYIELLKDLLAKKMLSLSLLGEVEARPDGVIKKIYRDTITLPVELVEEPDSFLFYNQGESMKEAGILDGDLLVIKNQDHAENGNIILAFVQGELTVKRYFKSSQAIKLEPDNHRMKPIFVKELQILGKVAGVLRKLNQ